MKPASVPQPSIPSIPLDVSQIAAIDRAALLERSAGTVDGPFWRLKRCIHEALDKQPLVTVIVGE